MSTVLENLKRYIGQSPHLAARITADSLVANPGMVVEIVETAVSVVPDQATKIADVAIKAAPEKTGGIAARAIAGNPEHYEDILGIALKARPDRAHRILNQAISENPQIERAIRDAFRQQIAASPAAPQKEPEPATWMEPPVADPHPEEQVSPVPPPVYRTVYGGPAATTPPPAAGPAVEPDRPPARAVPGSWSNKRGLAIIAAVIALLLCTMVFGGIYAVFYYFTDAGAHPDSVATSVALSLTETAQARPSPTRTATVPATATALPETIVPREPLTATGTSTAAAQSPRFIAAQNLFCREGPSAVYLERRTLNAGDAAPILGKGVSPVDDQSIWWLVEFNGAQCYVSSVLGSTEGNLDGLPEIAAPPTPTQTPTATSGGYPAPASPTPATPYP